jgi:hypothetical protein
MKRHIAPVARYTSICTIIDLVTSMRLDTTLDGCKENFSQ